MDFERTVEEVAKFKNSLRKPVAASKREAGAYPYYGAAGIQDWVSEFIFEGLHLLVGEDGTVQTADGRPLIQLVDGKFWVNNHAHVLVCDSDLDTRFLAYALNEAQVSPYVTGAAQPKLNMGNLKRIPIRWPEVKTRNEVAHIGKGLDDRIDLLRQTNTTLEAIAQALFKSWFVDFDPVRAKAEGREPEGMDAATAALFPSEFEESELGLIPKGWNVLRVEDVARKVAMGPFGSNIKVSTFVERGVPVISGQHLKGGALLEDSAFNFITSEHARRLSNSIVCPGDIVFTHAGNIGQVSLISEGAAYEAYVLSQRQFYLRCNLESTTPEFLVYFFRSPIGQHRLLANASQVGVPSIARPSSHLKSIELISPPTLLTRRFSALISSLHSQVVANRGRANCIAQVRDTLLPRLISGKLRLPDAERELAEVR